jgi:CRP/FNR family cyclic AMP-dependent transcriptional regulator
MTPAYDATTPRLAAPQELPLPQAQPAAEGVLLPQGDLGRGITLSAGETLYHQGDEVESAYLVASGLLALAVGASRGRERVVDLAGPGDLVGAVSGRQERYLDTATALGPDTRVVAVPLDAGSDAARDLLDRAAAQRLERLTAQLEEEGVPVAARVAIAFARLAERFGQEVADGMVRLTLPITHDTLAALVGAARETTSAAVQQLRRAGLIAGTRGRYLVLPRALRAFAQDASLN